MLNFLIPVDGSEPADATVKQLIKYLGWIKDEVRIHLLNVQPSFAYGRRVSAVIGKSNIARYQQEDGEAALKAAKKVLDKAGISYRASVATGDPSRVIVDYATKNRCDQILMGTRGMGSISGRMLGSVAARVIETSPVPVVVMKKR